MFNDYKFHHQSPISERNWHASNALHVARLVVFIFYIMTGIYFIKSKCKPDRIYVGSTVNIEKRFWQHKSNLRNNNHHSRKLQNHYNKYGFEDLEFTPMVIGVKPEELIQLEQDCLDSFKPYFNISPTARNCLGVKRTKETLKKMSEASKGKKRSDETRKNISESKKGEKSHMFGKTGENCHNYGKKHSEETRRKISEGNKGKIVSHEVRKIISETHKGRIFSKETRQKMSEAHKGKVVSEETKRKMSERTRGENHPLYGKKHSGETKIKMSQAKKGKKLSEEHKQKLLESRKGRKHSEETKRKISNARKGRTFPRKNTNVNKFVN